MTRQKKVFIAIAIVFVILLVIASWDIGRRTTFPGSKGQLKERLRESLGEKDTILQDSAQKPLNF